MHICQIDVKHSLLVKIGKGWQKRAGNDRYMQQQLKNEIVQNGFEMDFEWFICFNDPNDTYHFIKNELSILIG